MPVKAPGDMTVAHLMAHRTFRPGEGGVADADESLPLRPLLLQAVRKAGVMRQAGVARGTCVALALRNRPWRSVAVDYLACAWIGAVAVLAEDSQSLNAVDGPVTLMDNCVRGGEARRGASGREWPRPSDPLDIVFSSGTTGTPKPTVSCHYHWAYHPWWVASRARNRVVHCGIPFRTSTGVHGILLRHVAAAILSVAARSPEEIPHLVERFDCHELVVTPYALRKLLDCVSRKDALTRIKTVKVVAGPVSGRMASAAIDAFPDARILSIYGATEIGSAIFTRLVKRGESDALGVPSPGTAARIVNEHGAVVPQGAVGEIQVSQSVGAGKASPPAGSWTGTGDLGYIDKLGRVHLVGRAKEIMFLPSGRVAPAEVEDRLLENPLIADCGVAVVDGTEGWDKLGACLVLKDRGKIRQVEAALADIDPPLFRVRFVPSIPRTALGKPVRAQLRRLLLAPGAEGVWVRSSPPSTTQALPPGARGRGWAGLAGLTRSLAARAAGDNGKAAGDNGKMGGGELADPGRSATDERTAAEPEFLADRFFDREESWLRFNQRVLELAEDGSLPQLERVRFLSIFASNLDLFFMVRVAGRIRRMATGLLVEGVAGLPPDQILANTLRTAQELSQRHAECFNRLVQPALAAEGIEILRWKELSETEQEDLHELFRERIYPVLTPLIVDPAHPSPYISGLTLSLAVKIADTRTGATMFARVKVPPPLPRFLTVGQRRFVSLEDIIAAHLPELFSGLDILEHHTFRVTRTRDLEMDEDITENLLKSLEAELRRRRFEPAVRLEVEKSMSSDVLDKLVTELGVDRRAVYHLPGPLDLSGLDVIADLGIRQLKYPAFVPAESVLPPDSDIFTALEKQDVLVHHPYDSFTTVERLIMEAAVDPRVLAIKQTLYRTSETSSIVDALIDAAEAGKQVVVVVELKARFDERANISWARKLEEAGCHVIYGIVGLKTHPKMVLVVREEPDGRLRRYCHIGTGNYHPTTARLYEDFGLLTADRTVGEDATDLFNHLTGYSSKRSYRRFLVAPDGLRAGLLERIEQQVALVSESKPARIRLKCNAIIDEAVIDALYRASMVGVPVDLWVRGICSLRPGVPGMSENIRVRSILGRFLEHSRIFAFGEAQGPASEVWIGSADLMHRNLDRRVECLVRVTDPAQQADLRGLIDLAMDSGTASWWLTADGTWIRHHRDSSGALLRDLQQHLIQNLRGQAADA